MATARRNLHDDGAKAMAALEKLAKQEQDVKALKASTHNDLQHKQQCKVQIVPAYIVEGFAGWACIYHVPGN